MIRVPHRHRLRRHGSAFTLIELLVVIAIIGSYQEPSIEIVGDGAMSV